MYKKISVACLLFALALFNVTSASAKEKQEDYSVKEEIEYMCPEEIALREKLGITDDTPQFFATPITTGTGLTISSSGDAACSGSVSGGDEITSIQIFLYLQKNSDKTNVFSWLNSGQGSFYAVTNHHQLTARGTYIVKMSAYVYKKDGTYENLIRYSYTDTY